LRGRPLVGLVDEIGFSIDQGTVQVLISWEHERDEFAEEEQELANLLTQHGWSLV
jgi:hypothetical protein